ncbi:MAG: hypothetical protein ACXAC8_18395 [Candidatus Hodarchaeales archaeon]|jgi:hypothetical protein
MNDKIKLDELTELVFNPEYVQQVGNNTFIYTKEGKERFKKILGLD